MLATSVKEWSRVTCWLKDTIHCSLHFDWVVLLNAAGVFAERHCRDHLFQLGVVFNRPSGALGDSGLPCKLFYGPHLSTRSMHNRGQEITDDRIAVLDFRQRLFSEADTTDSLSDADPIAVFRAWVGRDRMSSLEVQMHKLQERPGEKLPSGHLRDVVLCTMDIISELL
jgi:hypothetical protein